MNTDGHIDAERCGYFGPPQRPLFGWLHSGGSGPLAGVAIVFCKPLAYEAMSAHRTVRTAALAAAAQGAATLRFDYDGTGDSAGDDLDAARVEAWLDSVAAAIELLQAAASPRRLCLWGLRAGSLLATAVAQRRGDVDLLVLTAPLTDGARFLREQRALAAAGNTPPPAADVQEVAGFLYTAATVTALSTLSLASATRAARVAALVQPRADLPFDARWPDDWRAAGSVVDVQPFVGYEAMLRDPHRVEVPQAMIDSTLDWLARFSAPGAGPAARNEQVLHEAAEPLPGVVRETALQLGSEPAAFAIVAEPVNSTAAPLLVLLNAGSVHHVGPNRMYVELSRSLAAQGVAVARIDMPGLGDATGYSDVPDNHPYPRHALANQQRTLQALREQLQPATLHVAGLCSGAYHTLQLAAAGTQVDSATIINPLTYDWREGMVVTMPESRVVKESSRYQRRALELSAWIKLFRGRVAFRQMAQIFARRLLQTSWRTLRITAAAVRLPIHSHLDRTLLAAAGHGVALRFLFADSDPGLAMLREQAPDTVARLQRERRLHIDVIDAADHTFTHFQPRQRLLERIGAALRR